jgi:tubulinyl-Tyr carboxypeptidase
MNVELLADVDVRAQARRIQSSASLPSPAVPEPPSALSKSKLPARDKLRQIQRYISALEYNHTGQGFYTAKKFRGFAHVANTAQEIMRESLPIQCVEVISL